MVSHRRRTICKHRRADAQNEAVTVIEERLFPILPRFDEMEETQDVKPTRYYLSLHKECNYLGQKRREFGLDDAPAQFPG